MSESRNEINVGAGGGWLALAMWSIMVWGDPDLLDALIAPLMGSCP